MLYSVHLYYNTYISVTDIKHHVELIYSAQRFLHVCMYSITGTAN